MTTITPDHDSGICHAASENRRMVLQQLKDLAYQLENCEDETKQTAGIQSVGCASPCYYPCGNTDCPPCSQPPKNGLQAPKRHNPLPAGQPHAEKLQMGHGEPVMMCEIVCAPVTLNRENHHESPNRRNVPPHGPNQGDQLNAPECSQGLSTDVSSFGHTFESRYVKPDPDKVPLITYPIFPAYKYRPRTPPERTDLNKRSNSRELLSGVMQTGCDCVRRNGLQDQCRRVECRGRPECVTKPEPQCIPSKVARGAHKEVMAYREAEKAQKENERPMVKVCCKCPPECRKNKQRHDNRGGEEEEAEERLLRELKKLYQQKDEQSKINNYPGMGMPDDERIYCCFPCGKPKK